MAAYECNGFLSRKLHGLAKDLFDMLGPLGRIWEAAMCRAQAFVFDIGSALKLKIYPFPVIPDFQEIAGPPSFSTATAPARL